MRPFETVAREEFLVSEILRLNKLRIRLWKERKISRTKSLTENLTRYCKNFCEKGHCFVRDAYDIDVHPIISLSNISRTIAVGICLLLRDNLMSWQIRLMKLCYCAMKFFVVFQENYCLWKSFCLCLSSVFLIK